MIKPNVDQQRCHASGTCPALGHNLFGVDQDGTLEQPDSTVGEDRGDNLADVVPCPIVAISRS